MWVSKWFGLYVDKRGQACGNHHQRKDQEKRRCVPLAQRTGYHGPREQIYIASIYRAYNSPASLSNRVDIAHIPSQSPNFLGLVMGAAVSVPSENIWCTWELVFDLMESIGGTESCMCWEAVLPVTRGFWTLEGFQSVTGLAWTDVNFGYADDVMKTNQSRARAQQPSHASEDPQFLDEDGERPTPDSKPTQSCCEDPLSMDLTSIGRVIIKLVENQICKPFADKLDKGWNLKAMHAPLLEVLEPRKAMEELAVDIGYHMKNQPIGGGPSFIKKSTEAEKQFWTLNTAEECRAFRRRQGAEKALHRERVRRGKRSSNNKDRKEGTNVTYDSADLGSDLAEGGQ